ncbi:hypothetical protein GGX14DRAFT_624781 [Mycena pura]|uniref:Uncharacterized protein n=1 Tax=Mycena pura TaxID=153505 RepID=A0AAD6VER3_9AGAR|nr:hypothetical protein GGX14DRAFT_624781 [Mycena pura]
MTRQNAAVLTSFREQGCDCSDSQRRAARLINLLHPPYKALKPLEAPADLEPALKRTLKNPKPAQGGLKPAQVRSRVIHDTAMGGATRKYNSAIAMHSAENRVLTVVKPGQFVNGLDGKHETGPENDGRHTVNVGRHTRPVPLALAPAGDARRMAGCPQPTSASSSPAAARARGTAQAACPCGASAPMRIRLLERPAALDAFHLLAAPAAGVSTRASKCNGGTRTNHRPCLSANALVCSIRRRERRALGGLSGGTKKENEPTATAVACPTTTGAAGYTNMSRRRRQHSEKEAKRRRTLRALLLHRGEDDTPRALGRRARGAAPRPLDRSRRSVSRSSTRSTASGRGRGRAGAADRPSAARAGGVRARAGGRGRGVPRGGRGGRVCRVRGGGVAVARVGLVAPGGTADRGGKHSEEEREKWIYSHVQVTICAAANKRQKEPATHLSTVLVATRLLVRVRALRVAHRVHTTSARALRIVVRERMRERRPRSPSRSRCLSRSYPNRSRWLYAAYTPRTPARGHGHGRAARTRAVRCLRSASAPRARGGRRPPRRRAGTPPARPRRACRRTRRARGKMRLRQEVATAARRAMESSRARSAAAVRSSGVRRSARVAAGRRASGQASGRAVRRPSRQASGRASRPSNGQAVGQASRQAGG